MQLSCQKTAQIQINFVFYKRTAEDASGGMNVQGYTENYNRSFIGCCCQTNVIDID